MSLSMKDADLTKTIALPATDGSVNSAGVDTGSRTAAPLAGELLEGELLVTAPALTTSELPDADTATYKLQHDDNSSFTSATDTADLLVQTGAGGAGADAATVRFRIPSDGERYWRVVVTTAGGAGDCSGKSAEIALVF